MRRGAPRALVSLVSLVAALGVLGRTEAQAQTAPTCDVLGSAAVPAGLLADACQKAQDVFRFMAPQVGVALSGGNVLPGEGGALGGWGKRSAVLRVTMVDGAVPARAVALTASGGPVASDFGAQRAPVPVPSLDVAVGVFRGVPVGLTNVGGIDLLGSLTFLPRVARDELRVAGEGSAFAGSIGARLGILQESAAVPGVAFSVMRRRLPPTSVRYRTADDTLGVFGARTASTVLRLTANKRFGVVAIGGGVGQDRLDTRATLEAIVNLPPPVPGGQVPRAVARIRDLRDETTRNTAFLNLGLGLARTQLVLEVGQSQAGDARQLLNTFGDRRANEAYRYGSIGLGVRF